MVAMHMQMMTADVTLVMSVGVRKVKWDEWKLDG